MIHVDATRKWVYGRMLLALGAIQAVTTCKHEIRSREQGTFALYQLPRCSQKQRQLVHAVVDDDAGLHSLHDRQRHGRVEPEHGLQNAPLLQELGEQSSYLLFSLGRGRWLAPRRQVRDAYP